MTRKFTSIFLICCFITGLLPMTVFATDTTSTSISVSCEAENNNDKNTAVIEPDDEDYRYTIRESTISFNGSETKSFVLDFIEPGDYYYKIHQSADASSSAYVDQKTHNVKVYVSWNENGDLVATPVIYMEGERNKEDGIHFLNVSKAHYVDIENGKSDSTETDNNSNSNDINSNINDISNNNNPFSSQTESAIAGNVRTGDQTPALGMLIMMLASAAVLAAIAKIRRYRAMAHD